MNTAKVHQIKKLQKHHNCRDYKEVTESKRGYLSFVYDNEVSLENDYKCKEKIFEAECTEQKSNKRV